MVPVGLHSNRKEEETKEGSREAIGRRWSWLEIDGEGTEGPESVQCSGDKEVPESTVD